ncbi:Ctf8p and Ctf18p associating protein [Kickxella alabastrina]|uniref:Ctf8p and Ctf18p associating protein n=1 Tax=Kickxella alabastrina TaxID=61397 RepID=A0ACC1I4R9_9FUNG|nr:Ctf8p and Ctf18p associating protein [Kickxella alabastrina]
MSSSSSAVFGLSASDGYPEEYRLLELTPEIVAQLESQSPTSTSSLRVRGRATDVATLIDLEDNAYNLHTSHTSNNLYLLTTEPATEPQGFSTLVLRSKSNQTLELQKIQPQIRARVVEVLQWDERGPFRGTEFDQQRMDDGVEGKRITDSVLAKHVQAGDRQLHRVLAEIPAFREASTGYWRMLDSGYCMDLLRLILATQVERDWLLDSLDPTMVYEALASDGEHLLFETVEAVLARFARSVESGYAIERRRVERYLAEQIFTAENMRAWPVSEFLLALHETTPPQLRSSEEHGRGEQWGSVQIPTSLVRDMAYASTPIDASLLYSTGGVSFHSTLLNPLFRSSLPNEPRSRLQRLFEIKPRWSRSEVRPFLEDLVDVDLDLLETGDEKTLLAAGKTIDAWLIKFGRGVKSPSGEMVYSSRVN